MGFGQRDPVLSQLAVEAVVNQFRQLLENHGKRTETELIFRSSQSFSLPMAVPSTLSSRLVIVSRLTAKTQIAFVSSVPSVYSVCSVVSSLEILLLNFRYTTSSKRFKPRADTADCLVEPLRSAKAGSSCDQTIR